MSIRKTALVLVSIMCILQVGKTAWRTFEVIRFASQPSELTHSCIGCNRVLDSYSLSIAAEQFRMAELEPVLSGTDSDQDSLSAFQELLILTSDEDIDCDKDGREDRLDGCPNCFGDGVRSKVLDAAIRKSLGVTSIGEGGGGDNREVVYVLLTGQESIGLESSSHVFVATSRSDEELLRALNPDGSYLETESVLFVPGAFYVYRVLHECGAKCGWGKLVLLLDLPFTGPTAVAASTIYTS